MKKLLAVLLVLAMLLSVAACGGSGSSTSGSEAQPVADHDPVTDPVFETKELLMSTSSSTSSYYIASVGLGEMINARNYGFTLSATTSGGSNDNVNRIMNGEAELGIGMPDPVYYAAHGQGAWEGKPVAVAPVCSVWSNPMNVVVRADSGITSVADFKGKTLASGAPGSGTDGLCRAILSAYGLDYDTDITWKYATIGEQCDMLKDKQVDGIMMSMGMGNASLTDLAATTEVVWLSLPADMLQKALEVAPFYTEVTMPAGTYPGVNEDKTCLGFPVQICASTERVSEDQCYLICKEIFDDVTALGQYHNAAKAVSLDKALDGVVDINELHPGAAKYFKEIGLIK